MDTVIGMNPRILAGPPRHRYQYYAFIMKSRSAPLTSYLFSGYFRIRNLAKSGAVVMTIIGILAVTASVAIFGRFANMNIW